MVEIVAETAQTPKKRAVGLPSRVGLATYSLFAGQADVLEQAALGEDDRGHRGSSSFLGADGETHVFNMLCRTGEVSCAASSRSCLRRRSSPGDGVDVEMS